MDAAVQSPPPPRREVAVLPGLEPVADRYDLILCDVWGVLHDGVTAHRAASEALRRFRAEGGRVVLVSNAPRPASAVIAQLDGLGVPRAAYDAVVTSGDLTRGLIEARRGEIPHHLGPERDRPLFDGLDLRLGALDEADYVVCTGLLDDEREGPEDYRPILDTMRSRHLLLVCANPDLVVERGDRLVPCAGAVARLYEESGGPVFYAGKPHRPIYERAIALGVEAGGGAPIRRERVLAIGDSLRTDIAGAAAAGLASLLVADGIHGEELGRASELLEQGSPGLAWLARQAHRPDAIVAALSW